MALFTNERLRPGWLRASIKMVQFLILTLLGLAALVAALLYIFQRKLIYFPRGYEAIELAAAPQVIRLTYQTACGAQVAYYIPPHALSGGNGSVPHGAPARLWVMFGGNASRALDWLEFSQRVPDDEAGFLLIDYPGYGECGGTPSYEGIGAAAPGALEALAQLLNTPRENLDRDLGVIGHSLGSAAALQFAVRAPVRRVILVSPFTDLITMARRSVGPFAFILKDRFDNAARIRELAARSPRPHLTIVHGTADDLIPFEMGRHLADLYPDWIEFVPIKGGDHNWILESAAGELYARMRVETASQPLQLAK